MLVFFILAIFGVHLIQADPISCTSVHFEESFSDFTEYNVSSIADFSLTVDPATNITYVSATNVSIFNYMNNEAATGICYYGICCSLPLSSPCTFDVRDTFVLLYANFSKESYTTFQGLIADDGTFSTSKLFLDDGACLSSYSSETDSVSNHSICCTVDSPAPVAPINSPKCRKFSSRTTVYNVNDNYSVYATSALNYELIGRTIVTSNFTSNLPSNYFACYFDHTFFNLPFACNNLGILVYNNVSMSDGDTKFLISTFYLPYGTIFGINGIESARFLYRDGQLLMKEGVPFTPQNNCLYFPSVPWYPSPATHSSSSEFCCITFEN